MKAWGKQQNIKHIEFIPDGSGVFTKAMGMNVKKNNIGFGERSWRYACIVNDGVIEAWFEEEGRCDNCEEDPYGISSPQNILKYLKEKAARA